MTDQQILIKAIEKAVKNGFHDKGLKDPEEIIANHFYLIRDIVFSHDFAKAFFGPQTTDYVKINGNDFSFGPNLDGWRYYLSKMVLEEDPIKYLERFL